MSKRQHQRQVAKARAKRQADRFERRRRRSRLVAVVAAGAMLLGVFAIVLVTLLDDGPADGDDASLDDPVDEAAADAEPCPEPGDVPEPEGQTYDGPPETTIDEDATYVATLDTTCGELLLELDPGGAPTAVNSFVFLAREGYFDGVPFHRVVPGFVIQGGDPTGTGTGGPGYTFEDELETAEELVAEHGGYPYGTLAMANAGPDTNGSQFFVTLGDPVGLAPDFTAFGEVIDGMDVAERIGQGPAEGDQAIDPVRILSVEIDEG